MTEGFPRCPDRGSCFSHLVLLPNGHGGGSSFSLEGTQKVWKIWMGFLAWKKLRHWKYCIPGSGNNAVHSLKMLVSSQGWGRSWMVFGNSCSVGNFPLGKVTVFMLLVSSLIIFFLFSHLKKFPWKYEVVPSCTMKNQGKLFWMFWFVSFGVCYHIRSWN